MAITLLGLVAVQAAVPPYRVLPELLVVAVAVPVLDPPVFLVTVGLAALAASTMPIHKLQIAPRRVRVAAVVVVVMVIRMLRVVLGVLQGATVVAVAAVVVVLTPQVAAATDRKALLSLPIRRPPYPFPLPG